jgi:hypothetical protein
MTVVQVHTMRSIGPGRLYGSAIKETNRRVEPVHDRNILCLPEEEIVSE